MGPSPTRCSDLIRNCLRRQSIAMRRNAAHQRDAPVRESQGLLKPAAAFGHDARGRGELRAGWAAGAGGATRGEPERARSGQRRLSSTGRSGARGECDRSPNVGVESRNSRSLPSTEGCRRGASSGPRPPCRGSRHVGPVRAHGVRPSRCRFPARGLRIKRAQRGGFRVSRVNCAAGGANVRA